jgi:hypothetical protein
VKFYMFFCLYMNIFPLSINALRRLIFVDFERINYVILHPSPIWIFVGAHT